MRSLTLSAPAKLNLTLDILSRRPDGYHEMSMVMQSVSLCDTVRLELGEPGPIRCESGLSYLPSGRENLAVSAALAFQAATGRSVEGLRIVLEKRIPVCAGTAGGSSDAAAVLRGLDALTGTGLDPLALAEIGAAVGSDVPYCVLGGTALAEGRGERLTPLSPLPSCTIVLCKPRSSVSTPALFQAWDRLAGRRLRPDTAGVLDALAAGDLAGVARRCFNVFETALPPRQRQEVASIKQRLIDGGALGAAMSGSGPTVFGLFDRPEAAERAARALRADCPETFLTVPVGPETLV